MADLTFINLENTLTTSGYYTGFPLFRSPKEIAGALSDTGVDVAVMANNHGVVTTIALPDSAGVKHTGVFADSRRFIREHPLILQANGLPTPDASFAVTCDIAPADRTEIDCITVFFFTGDTNIRDSRTKNKKHLPDCVTDMVLRLSREVIRTSYNPSPSAKITKEKNKLMTILAPGTSVLARRTSVLAPRT
jgi:hypothetical protein